MAEYIFTAALNPSQIPFISRQQQRSIMIGQLDNRLRDPASSTQDNRENNPQNLPQLLYCENVMPLPEGGLKSVRYFILQDQFANPADFADTLFILRDPTEAVWYWSPARGKNYVSSQLGVDPWVSKSPLAVNDAFTSVGYVNGITYVCYSGIYFGHWDSGINNFVDDSAGLIGIAAANIRAIAGVGNYLVVITTDNAVHWSSLVNPLDFTPSVETGAGSQTPVDLRGAAIYLTVLPGGFLIHCTETTIAALYTQNSASPWIFREVKNAGGVTNPMLYLAKDPSSGTVTIYGTKGLQQLDLREATSVHPELVNFLGSGVIETFDTTTNLLTITRLPGSTLRVKVRSLLNRYLCVSYGANAPSGTNSILFNYLLIYDTLLRRWGKLRIQHADVFAISLHDDVITGDSIIDSLAVLQLHGVVVSIIQSAVTTSTDVGVAILGRYQLSRTSNICSQEVRLELLDSSETTTVHVAGNYDGSNLGEIHEMVEYADTGNYRCYQYQLEAENLTYIIKGDFSLTTAILTVTKGCAV